MERLDKGNIHPKLEILRLTSLGRESNPASVVGGEHSSKEQFEQPIKSYSEHIHDRTITDSLPFMYNTLIYGFHVFISTFSDSVRFVLKRI
jgi:hypothetical protein